MKKQTKLKAFMLSLMMLANIFLPATVNAQKSDGFFRGGANDNYENRDGEQSETMTTQNFGESAPLGCGLLIMLGAGAGYALLKKKED